MNPRTQIMINHAIRSALNLRNTYAQHGDTKHHQSWNDYGYPELITFDMHYLMYSSFGIAAAGIDKPVNKCWMSYPTIREGIKEDAETPDDRSTWESQLDDLFDRLSLFNVLKEVDRKQSVGQYAGLIIQVAGTGDDIDWSKPLGRIRPEQIVGLIEAYEGQLESGDVNQDKSSPRYGQPEFYNYNESEILERSSEGKRFYKSGQVHHSRVIIFPEGASSGSIYGRPKNEKGFNSLIDLVKICGAGGEGLWKNSTMKTVFANTDKDARPPDREEIDAMDAALKEFFELMDKYVMTGGLKPEVLSANLPQPKEFFENSLNVYAASVGVPSKILIGAQTGRLAADEDGLEFLSDCQSRREGWCTTMINLTVDWLIEHVMPRAKYFVEWDDLLAPSDKDKLELADKMATINQKLIAMGEAAFTVAEMRKFAGFEPLEESEIVDIDDEEAMEGVDDQEEQ